MRTFRFQKIAAVIAVGALTACSDALEVTPYTQVAEELAIVDANSARAAVSGMYDGLQSGSYYGGSFVYFQELPTDNFRHSGTFSDYADMDQLKATADNGTINTIWDAIYNTIGRTNAVIDRIPGVGALTAEEKNDMVGQAHLVRALAYHDLVKLFGGVPIRLVPTKSANELANTERASVADVYTQILADIAAAEQKLTNDSDLRRANVYAVLALKNRVAMFRQDWATVISSANTLSADFTLAAHFEDLFTPDGADTPEDLWRVSFTATESNNHGFFYFPRSFGGRYELAPTANLFSAIEADDERGPYTALNRTSSTYYSPRYSSAVGGEHVHIIRYAEILLNKAEAQARLNQLSAAVTTYNLIRARAGLTPHILGVDVTTQAQVLAAISQERRIEFAGEGDRYTELTRTGRYVSLMSTDPFRVLFPIPQPELDVAPKLVQNTGY